MNMGFCQWCGNNPPSEDGACTICNAHIRGDGKLTDAKEVFDLIASHYGVCCKGIVPNKKTVHKRFPDASLIREILWMDQPEPTMKALLMSPIHELIDASHLFIHPKGGESHTKNTAVECGVALYYSYARCYWIYDSDRAGFCDSHEYGPEIPYSLGEKAFMAMVSLVLNLAAKVAEDNGVRSCPNCGDHYYEESPCDCQEAEAQEADDPTATNP
jgi:hypothetical protein